VIFFFYIILKIIDTLEIHIYLLYNHYLVRLNRKNVSRKKIQGNSCIDCTNIQNLIQTLN